MEALKDSRLDIGPIMGVLKDQKVIEARQLMILEKMQNLPIEIKNEAGAPLLVQII